MCRMICAVGKVNGAQILSAITEMSRCKQSGSSPTELNENSTDASNRHCDGWGAAYRLEDGSVVALRSAESIGTDPAASVLASVSTSALVIHARQATVASQLGNAFTHPISRSDSGRSVHFFHNGYAPDVHKLLGRPQAEWDTRDLHDWLLADYQPETWLTELPMRLAQLPPTTTSANFILVDGDIVIACSWFPESSPRPAYYTLHLHEAEGFVVVSSEPVESIAPANQWRPLVNGKPFKLTV